MDNLLQGIVLGLTLSLLFSFGPATFALIQTSIHRGFWSGAQLAFGIFLSDSSLLALGFYGAVQIFYQPDNQLVFGIVGGVLLIIFGLVSYTRKVYLPEEEENSDIKISKPGPLTFILKGFFINFTNPFVWIFWMTIVVSFTANFKGDSTALFIFFAATLGVVFMMDVLKCFSAYKIKKYIQSHRISLINKIAGVGLVIFGIYLIVRTLVEIKP